VQRTSIIISRENILFVSTVRHNNVQRDYNLSTTRIIYFVCSMLIKVLIQFRLIAMRSNPRGLVQAFVF